MVNTVAEMEVVPIGGPVGAEVKGVDWSQPIPGDLAQALKQAWIDHMVLLFRGRMLEDLELLSVTEVFGGSQAAKSREFYMKAGFEVGSDRVSKFPALTLISNLDEDGQPVLKNASVGSLELNWHTDNSYTEVPPAGTLLNAHILPVDGGGDTSFANQYLAYETLPEDLKQIIQGKHQRHDISRTTTGTLRPAFVAAKTQADVEGPVHPMARIHPESGKTALYLGRQGPHPSSYILELDEDESLDVMGRLWAHATQPKFVWTHKWQLGDLLIWDNRCVKHHRTKVDPTQARVLHRALIKGEPVISAWDEVAAAE
ncbi:MAG: TauD/TfdA family dioxygenase [Proteobacteria bacterium]|nr:TauD/TfdA family dioxygenase [Pseudomonadota bacterium]